MMQFTRRVLIFSITVLFVVAFWSPLFADVTVERDIKSDGLMGMGASKSYNKESIQGEKKHVDSKMKLTGKFLSKMSGEKKTSTVFRISKDIIWEIDHKKKTYTERTISLPKGEEPPKYSDSEGGNVEEQGREEESKVKIIKNEFNVKNTGEKKTINGFTCSQHILTWLVETENIETKERSKSLMTTELWNTPENEKIRKLKKEEEEFNRAYLIKLGLKMRPEEMKGFGLSILGGMANASGMDLKKEFSKIKGYPIVTSVKWQSQTDGKRQDNEKAEEEEDEGMDLSKGLGGAFGGFMKKKMAKRDKKKAEEKEDMKVMFESYSEIKSITTSSLPKDLFEVPKGYKKGKSWMDRLNKE
jgi:hypothetical protein